MKALRIAVATAAAAFLMSGSSARADDSTASKLQGWLDQGGEPREMALVALNRRTSVRRRELVCQNQGATAHVLPASEARDCGRAIRKDSCRLPETATRHGVVARPDCVADCVGGHFSLRA